MTSKHSKTEQNRFNKCCLQLQLLAIYSISKTKAIMTFRQQTFTLKLRSAGCWSLRQVTYLASQTPRDEWAVWWTIMSSVIKEYIERDIYGHPCYNNIAATYSTTDRGVVGGNTILMMQAWLQKVTLTVPPKLLLIVLLHYYGHPKILSCTCLR